MLRVNSDSDITSHNESDKRFVDLFDIQVQNIATTIFEGPRAG